jgi:excisionase family DNA binding protein
VSNPNILSRERPLPEYLSAAEVSAALHVTVGTARTMMRTGRIPGVRLGGQGPWRVQRAALEKMLEPEK